MILLDTHVLVWTLLDPKKLSRRARQAIQQARASGGVAIASITLWELAWLAENRRIQVAGTVEAFVRDCVAKVSVRPLTPAIASNAVALPVSYPRDPQDRIIGATAIVEAIPLVTADERIRNSRVIRTIW